MKSSPKTSELPPSTASKTPASGKKLIQARLSFKALGGSEPPVSAQNDTSETALATSKTLTPVMDNRKRKQNTSASKEDGLRAAKINRSEFKNSDVVVLETNEIMELSNDVPTGNGTESNTKTGMPSRKSESKENVCLDKSTVDEIELSDDSDEAESVTNEPKAKQSLEFGGKRLESRKSKRLSDPVLIQIKLPISKKAKDAAKKKAKKQKKTESDVQMEADKLSDTEENMDMEASASTVEEENLEHNQSSGDEDLDECVLNESAVSNVSDKCLTPSNKLTPKQIQRRVESEKKKQEKEQAKLERERKLQREKEERELQKKREREEKG